nr:uncharacterized protein LOC109166654 isoform X1 [Ipomoea batatas]
MEKNYVKSIHDIRLQHAKEKEAMAAILKENRAVEVEIEPVTTKEVTFVATASVIGKGDPSSSKGKEAMEDRSREANLPIGKENITCTIPVCDNISKSYQNVEGRFGNAKGSMQGNPSRQNTRPNTMTNLSSFASLFSGDVSKGDGNVFGGFPQPTITKKSPEIHRGIPTVRIGKNLDVCSQFENT